MIPLPWRKPARPTIALDLGSVSTRVVAAERGLVADLPSVVALQDGNDGRRAVAVGGKAHELLGRGVPGLRVVQPIRGGLIEDYEASEHLLRHALEQGGGAAPRILVAVPFDATETERRALQSAARAAGAAEVEVVAAPLAAAIGAQLHVREPVERIRDAVLDALRETPPELCADVLASGVILVGGGARLAGLDLVLRDATGLPILHAEHPEHAVAHGLARLLDDAGLHEDVVAAAG
jgi:rod shape-determining protein MreB